MGCDLRKVEKVVADTGIDYFLIDLKNNNNKDWTLPFGSVCVYISHKECLKYELVSIPLKMDAKSSMRIMMIAMLLF